MSSGNGQSKPKVATARQRAFVAWLLVADAGTAAREVGISERTARRWRRDPVVQAELSRLTDLAAADAAARFSGSLAVAAETLRRILLDEEISPAVRASAAARVVDAAAKMKDTADLSERISRLEKMSR